MHNKHQAPSVYLNDMKNDKRINRGWFWFVCLVWIWT